jgi:hypothetical protein
MEEAIADELLIRQAIDCFQKIKGKIQKTYATKKAVLKQGKYLCYRMKIVPPRVKFLVRFKITIGDYRGTSFLQGLVQRNGFR